MWLKGGVELARFHCTDHFCKVWFFSFHRTAFGGSTGFWLKAAHELSQTSVERFCFLMHILLWQRFCFQLKTEANYCDVTLALNFSRGWIAGIWQIVNNSLKAFLLETWDVWEEQDSWLFSSNTFLPCSSAQSEVLVCHLCSQWANLYEVHQDSHFFSTKTVFFLLQKEDWSLTWSWQMNFLLLWSRRWWRSCQETGHCYQLHSLYPMTSRPYGSLEHMFARLVGNLFPHTIKLIAIGLSLQRRLDASV